MPSTTIVLSPLGPVRDAVYARIATDANTSGYTLATEGSQVSMPYLVVGPAYKGAGGTDPGLVADVVVQVDAYAGRGDGGAAKVNAMMADVAEALSASGLTATVDTEAGSATSAAFAIVVEDDVLNPNLFDPDTKETYAQRFVRFRFIVTT